MSDLHVRNLPPELHERLREQAIADGRSMSAQAVALLKQALGPVGDQPARHRAAMERLQEIQRRSRLPEGLPLAEELVREDRDAVT
ncbi:MAG: FitA-like ribbon-helix-helix domain-containing protein [Marmoricola sp.]